MLFEDLRIKDVHAVLQYTPSMKRWSAKNRKNHFVGIMLGGKAHHDFGYQKFVLSRNCIYFFNQRDNYDVEVEEAGVSFSAHFTTYEELETDSFCILIENPDAILTLLQRAERLRHASGEGELALLSTLYRLCDAISHARQKAYFPKDARMDAARDYIDTHFKERDCIAVAVERSGLSSRRFGDLFKGNFGATPNSYLIRRRIEHARAMLETGSLSVSETAELCGFSDVYYFSKVFKQLCGVPPSKF